MIVNRAPVLTLWAAVVAERLGHDWNEALTLGKVLAGLNAQSKGQRLGIYGSTSKTGKSAAGRKRVPEAPVEEVELFDRRIPVARTRDGVRAIDKSSPVDPASVDRYLESKFGDALPATLSAMKALARSVPPKELAARGFEIYEAFRPEVPRGERGWGAKGVLDLGKITELSRA